MIRQGLRNEIKMTKQVPSFPANKVIRSGGRGCHMLLRLKRTKIRFLRAW